MNIAHKRVAVPSPERTGAIFKTHLEQCNFLPIERFLPYSSRPEKEGDPPNPI